MNIILSQVTLFILFCSLLYWKCNYNNKEKFTFEIDNLDVKEYTTLPIQIVKNKDIGDIKKEKIKKTYIFRNSKLFYYYPDNKTDNETDKNTIYSYNELTYNNIKYNTKVSIKDNDIVVQGDYVNLSNNEKAVYTISYMRGNSNKTNYDEYSLNNKIIISISIDDVDIIINGIIEKYNITFLYNDSEIGYYTSNKLIIKNTFHNKVVSDDIIFLLLFSNHLSDYINEIDHIIL